LSEYIWFNGHPVAQIDGTVTHWTFTDHLGTPLIQTTSTQVPWWRAEYEPFGRVFSLQTADQHQPLRLPGQEAEQLNLGQNGATERSYNIFRWYRPNWGRYTQPDPLGIRESGDTNPYRYAQDNPLSFYDLTGEKARVCCTPITEGGFLSRYQHCFIDVVDESTNAETTYGLHRRGGFLAGFVGVTGCKRRNAEFDVQSLPPSGGTQCGDWSSGCSTDLCVEALHGGYPNPSRYRNLGSNSNTYASHIANNCGLVPPALAGTSQTPGWGHPLPRQIKGTCPVP
jgi:RHS repeat-associated protein